MREIELTRGLAALVDDCDYERVSTYKWQAKPSGNTVYAHTTVLNLRTGKPTTITMHRVIMGLQADDKRVVDHRDWDGLNNQRGNLRVCERNSDNVRAQKIRRNPLKKSAYRGVTRDDYALKRVPGLTKSWVAQISYDGRPHRIGRYATEQEAASAYNAVAAEKFGEFAVLNQL